MRALIADPGFAVCSGVTRRAAARVGALAGVSAGGAVLARPVVGAVVEILVAEEPAPAFIAEAVVGLLAGSVHTARIPDALVAEGARPTGLASEK